PHAAMDHANSEPGGATVAGTSAATAAESSEPSESAPAPAAAAAPASAAAEPAEALEVTGAAARVHAGVGRAREPDVGVRTARALRVRERDVGQPLEFRLEHAALGRLGNQIADEIAGGDRHPGDRHGLDEVASFHVTPRARLTS